MQLKTILILLFVLAIASSFAEAAPKDDFLKATGLRMGPIELIDGGEDCMYSNLRLIEIDDGSLTLSLGAEPLIMGLGVGTTTDTERGCTTEETATYGTGKADYKKKQVCGKNVLQYFVTVGVTGEGFEFSKLNKQNGKIVKDLTCKFKFFRG
jgi:hypothetical protein